MDDGSKSDFAIVGMIGLAIVGAALVATKFVEVGVVCLVVACLWLGYRMKSG